MESKCQHRRRTPVGQGQHQFNVTAMGSVEASLDLASSRSRMTRTRASLTVEVRVCHNPSVTHWMAAHVHGVVVSRCFGCFISGVNNACGCRRSKEAFFFPGFDSSWGLGTGDRGWGTSDCGLGTDDLLWDTSTRWRRHVLQWLRSRGILPSPCPRS